MGYAYFDGQHVWGSGYTPEQARDEAEHWTRDDDRADIATMQCYEATADLMEFVDACGGCGENGEFTILGDGRLGLASEAKDTSIKTISELKSALRAALDWIDAVPKDIVLPTMPGFDRDEVEKLLS